jgi:2,3-bisphosphoglycerate-dependent phosphoglycerate mutase
MDRSQLILLRHGESTSNRERRFTGWADAELTAQGRDEARLAGTRIAAHGLRADACFSSRLRRAKETARLALDTMGRPELSVNARWRLNERHCGDLEGLHWWQAVRRYGPLLLLRYRRDENLTPPPLHDGDARLPANDPRYADVPPAELPRGESTRAALARLLPCWETEIAPLLREGAVVLVVSHKNLLRGFLRLLSQGTGAGTKGVHFAPGEPLLLELDENLTLTGHRRL